MLNGVLQSAVAPKKLLPLNFVDYKSFKFRKYFFGVILQIPFYDWLKSFFN
jgi:hypothetical protein